MKLVIAIVNHDDANLVTQSLAKAGFSSTKLPTTGGFLMAGNVTVLVGVEDEKVDEVMSIIHEHSHSRKQIIPASYPMAIQGSFCPSPSIEVTVGGATVFVVDVERFERL